MAVFKNQEQYQKHLEAELESIKSSQNKIQDTAGKKVENIVAHQSGATSSHFALRYDLIPRPLLDALAHVYTEGAKKHGPRGYQRGLTDKQFILDRINHMFEHMMKLIHPSPGRNVDAIERSYANNTTVEVDENPIAGGIGLNIGAIGWALGFLCEVFEHPEGRHILLEILQEGACKDVDPPAAYV